MDVNAPITVYEGDKNDPEMCTCVLAFMNAAGKNVVLTEKQYQKLQMATPVLQKIVQGALLELPDLEWNEANRSWEEA